MATESLREHCQQQHRIFVLGWRHGRAGVAPQTARLVSHAFPDYSDLEITLYLNGAEDGRANDRFRREMPCGLCGNNNA